MPNGAIPITRRGYNKLLEEHTKLVRIDRPDIIRKIAEARSNGDLRENAEFHAAKEQQSYIESRIQLIEDRIARSEIANDRHPDTDEVTFGSRLRVLDLSDRQVEHYTLVGPAEADPGAGTISVGSPIARALMGKRAGDIVEIDTPGGLLQLKILALS